jgi:hypothetical protein
MIVGAVVAALIIGFTAGLLAFRVKNRWCPACGATTFALAERPSAGPVPQPTSSAEKASIH